MSPPSEVVDALEHDLPEVFAMSDGQSVNRACQQDINDASSVHSESCWSETEGLSAKDEVEQGILPPAGSVAVHTAREEGDSAAPHPPTRRLVLVGGVSRSQNRFSLLEREEEETEVHVHGQDRQRGMRASQRCAREFSQRSVSATVVDHTVSQNLGSQIRAEEDQPMSGDEVFVDGDETLRRERNKKKFLLMQLRTPFLVKSRREMSQSDCKVWTKWI